MQGIDDVTCAAHDGGVDLEAAAVAAEAAAALAVADDGTSLIELWPAGSCVGTGCFGRTFVMPCHRTYAPLPPLSPNPPFDPPPSHRCSL